MRVCVYAMCMRKRGVFAYAFDAITVSSVNASCFFFRFEFLFYFFNVCESFHSDASSTTMTQTCGIIRSLGETTASTRASVHSKSSSSWCGQITCPTLHIRTPSIDTYTIILIPFDVWIFRHRLGVLHIGLSHYTHTSNHCRVRYCDCVCVYTRRHWNT